MPTRCPPTLTSATPQSRDPTLACYAALLAAAPTAAQRLTGSLCGVPIQAAPGAAGAARNAAERPGGGGAAAAARHAPRGVPHARAARAGARALSPLCPSSLLRAAGQCHHAQSCPQHRLSNRGSAILCKVVNTVPGTA